MFEKTLQGMVRGIRSSKKDSKAFIAKCIAEIRVELKSANPSLKSQALQKLTYLHMSGYDASWAAFQIIEVMTQERFELKRVGYLAASQTFTAETDVVLLCTQLFKKDFQAQSQYEIGLAINCLSNICTPDLARELLNDCIRMLSSSKPYIRKKAVLVLYKMFLKYPKGLRVAFPQLQRRLEDDNQAVQSCAVNVICELARYKPSNYLSLAPTLFGLLTKSHNNWMLIKVVKLLGQLVGEEPRLARKLLAPLAEIIQTTPAKSLMYECINTLTEALLYTKKADGSDARNAPKIVRLCTDKLREFIKDMDQNLKYLGLVGLVKLMRSNPRVVAEHRELVQQCLLDEDVTVKLRALELITGMVTVRNLPDVVQRLLEHVQNAEGHYRDELMDKIVYICSRDRFAYLRDFAWYITVIVKLAYVQGTKQGPTLASQLLDVAVRVKSVRAFAVAQMVPLLCDADTSAAAAGESSLTEVRWAAAWIVGEYASLLEAADYERVIAALSDRTTLSLPPKVQAVYLQCAFKVVAEFAAASAADRVGSELTAFPEVAVRLCTQLREVFGVSKHVEVQERAISLQALLVALGVDYTPPPIQELRDEDSEPPSNQSPVDLIDLGFGSPPALEAEAPPADEEPAAEAGAGAGQGATKRELDMAVLASVLQALRADKIKAVKARAQQFVEVPAGLDLDAQINPAPVDDSADGEDYSRVTFAEYFASNNEDDFLGGGKAGSGGVTGDAGAEAFAAGFGGSDSDEDLFAELSGSKPRRGGKARGSSANNPWLLSSSPTGNGGSDGGDVDDIPIEHVSISELGGEGPLFTNKPSGSPGASLPTYNPSNVDMSYTVESEDDMPAGYNSDDAVRARGRDSDDEGLDGVDLTTPLGPDDVLHERKHYDSSKAGSGAGRKRSGKGDKASKKKKKKHKHKHEEEGKKSKKKSKKSKKKRRGSDGGKAEEEAGEGAGAGAAAPEVVEVMPAKAAQKSSPVTVYEDKVVRVTAVARVTHMCAGLTSLPGDSTAVVGAAVITFTAAPRSSKKGLEYLDIAVQKMAAAPFPGNLQLPAGAMRGTTRVASGLKPKAKGKNHSQSLEIPVQLTAQTMCAGLATGVLVMYKVAGSSDEVPRLRGSLALKASALLVPTVIDVQGYKNVLTNPPSPLFHSSTSLPVGEAGSKPVIKSVLAMLPCTLVQANEGGAVSFSRTLTGFPVTAMLKVAESTVEIVIKTTSEPLAAAIVANISTLSS